MHERYCSGCGRFHRWWIRLGGTTRNGVRFAFMRCTMCGAEIDEPERR